MNERRNAYERALDFLSEQYPLLEKPGVHRIPGRSSIVARATRAGIVVYSLKEVIQAGAVGSVNTTEEGSF